MFSTLAITAALLTPAAPMPKDTTPNPTGLPPQVVYFSKPGQNVGGFNAPNAAVPQGKPTINLITYTTRKVETTVPVVKNVNGKNQVVREKKEIEQRTGASKPLGERGEVFATADGSKLSTEEAVRRLSGGAVALVSMDGKPIDAAWLRVVDRDLITIHSKEITGQVSAGYSRTVKTPAPRLTMLTPDSDGVLRVTASAPQASDPNNIVFAGNGGIVVQANVAINGAAPVPASEDKVAKQPGDRKTLEEINFEAYTANGDTVSKTEVLKRLKAGGIVAIAGSNQKPDETYLKSFTPDLLVLVSAELASGNRSGSSTGMIPLGGGAIQIGGGPIQIQVKPLPAPVPAQEDPAEAKKPEVEKK